KRSLIVAWGVLGFGAIAATLDASASSGATGVRSRRFPGRTGEVAVGVDAGAETGAAIAQEARCGFAGFGCGVTRARLLEGALGRSYCAREGSDEATRADVAAGGVCAFA